MAQKLTVYQKLTHMLGNEANTPTYVIDPNQLKNLQGNELEQKKLEAQQTMYLQSQWKKIDNELYQKAVYYEPTRISSYYDYEAMEYSIVGDTQIATPEGFTSIKDLADMGRDHEFIVYSYDHNLKKVVPAIARNAHYTRDEMTYKITFDDGKFIIATYGHRFLKRNGVFELVENLKAGDSMMPFYRKSFYNNEKYNWVYTCNSDEGHHGWVSEHNMVAEWFYGRKIDNKIEEVHHIDFNGKNNMPENLKIMTINEHRGYHARLNNEKLWTNPEYRAKMLEIGKRTDNKHHWNGARSGENNPSYKKIPFDLIIETAKKYKTLRRTASALNVSYRKIQRDIVSAGYNDWLTFLGAYGIIKHKYATAHATCETLNLNHKIVSIEPYGIVPVYDLTVPNYKNFATDSIFSHNTPEIAVALDIFADEATVADDQGNILQIYSENTRIKDELTDLFINKLDANTNLTAWARNLPIKHDSIIPLLNGENITIKEIAERLKNNPEIPLYTYAIQDETQNIVAGKIVWCDLTRKDCDIIRVYLDDNTYVETAPDHEFMLRNGNYKRADKLSPNDSLMPYYTRISEKPKDLIRGYEKIYNPSSDYFKYTHRIVSEHLRDSIKESGIKRIHTHHVDFNKLNNNPKNLIRLPDRVHLQIHRDLAREVLHDNKEIAQRRMDGIDRYLRSDKRKKRMSEEMMGIYPKYFEVYNNSNLHSEHNQIRALSMLQHWSNNVYKEKTRERMTLKLSEEGFNHITDIIQNSDAYIGIYQLADILKRDKDFISIIKRDNNHFRKDLKKSINAATLGKIIKRQLNLNYFDWLLTINGGLINNNRFNCAKLISEHNVKNHKVLRTELLSEKHDVYCMEIKGLDGEDDRHNFPVCSKDSNGDFTRNGVFVSNCKYGDNFCYLKIIPNEGIIGVTQLPNVEITRSEPGFTKIASHDDQKAQKSTQFFWRDKNIEFNSFEVAHFRLTGDDRRMPYGTSMLEKARRIWKQLLLSEDAMLVYRTTRAPERRVFKIFVGNMDDKDVDAYVDKIANNFKRVSMSAGEGGADTRYNPIAVDQDYFIPVRDPQLTMPIETLAGAQNLGEIADVEFIQKKLIMAMRIPKAFIGFEEVTGDGKNLAILDVRFARAVQRLQKALIQELNKMAIIHLYLKGFEDDLHNFTLALANPSTQAVMLKIEAWKEKVALYRDAVGDAGNGYGAMSMTMAKKEFFNMSEEDIKLDVQRQAIERAGSEELKMIAETIKQTGIFSEVYRMYKIDPNNMMQDPNEPEEGEDGGEGFEPAGGGSLGQDFSTNDSSNLGGEEPSGGAGVGGEPMGDVGLGGLNSGENLAEQARRGLKTYNSKMRMRTQQMLNEIDKTMKELKL